jgi:hypothetical protein
MDSNRLSSEAQSSKFIKHTKTKKYVKLQSYQISKFTERIEIKFKQLFNDNSVKIEIKAREWRIEFQLHLLGAVALKFQELIVKFGTQVIGHGSQPQRVLVDIFQFIKKTNELPVSNELY